MFELQYNLNIFVGLKDDMFLSEWNSFGMNNLVDNDDQQVYSVDEQEYQVVVIEWFQLNFVVEIDHRFHLLKIL